MCSRIVRKKIIKTRYIKHGGGGGGGAEEYQDLEDVFSLQAKRMEVRRSTDELAKDVADILDPDSKFNIYEPIGKEKTPVVD